MNQCEAEKIRKIHPKEKANCLSVLSFFYTLSLFRKGFKRDLEEDDLYEVLSDYRSQLLGDQLETEWEKQMFSNTKKLSISRLLWACYGWRYLIIGLTQLIVKTTLIVLQPTALGKLVSYFVPGQTTISREDAYLYACVVVGLNFLSCIYVHNYHLIVTGLGIQIRTAFCSFIYRKTLKLAPERLDDISIGNVVTLITKDVHSFESFIHFANDIWIGIVKTAVICFVIYQRIGVAALAGVGFFLVILPLQIYMGAIASRLRMKMCKETDKRLQLTQETLSAIKIIKMYTWERIFNDKISAARKNEISKMHKIFYLKFLVLILGVLNAKIAFYLLIMTHIWMGNSITAEIIYFIVSCFQILTHTLSILFPLGIAQTAELFASVKRIGNVLKALELQQQQTSDDEKPMKTKIIDTEKNTCQIRLIDVSVAFKQRQILSNINVTFDTPSLTLVTGPVGSGKTFLLKTILGDYRPVEGGRVLINGGGGGVSYASQEPWLFPSTIKQNILFGQDLDEERYQRVLYVCALQYDLELLTQGDSTIVEDRGINLSKGQQARINLARAVYKNADFYILDDCLAALDAHVSDFIFNECLRRFLHDKCVILVSHNTACAQYVDRHIVLTNGTVSNTNPDECEKPPIGEPQETIREPIESPQIDSSDTDDALETDKLLCETEPVAERKVYQEAKQIGSVNFAVYRKYIDFGGGMWMFGAVFLVFIASQVVISYTDKLVSTWVNVEQELSNFTTGTANFTMEYIVVKEKRDFLLTLYTIMIVLSSVLALARSFALFALAKRASIKLHNYMTTKLIFAAMQFFDQNFIGNILNRFSKDLTTIDETIPFVFYHVFRVFLILAGIIILIMSVNMSFLVPTVIFFVTLTIIRRAYLPTGRSLKRLDCTTRAPVVGYLNATLEGLTTIRAFKAQHIVRKEFDRHQDLYTSANYVFQCSMRAFAFCLDTLCTFFIGLIVARFVIFDQDTLAGNVGLAISQAFLMTGTLQWGIRQWAEMENQMTSVERVLEYTEVKQEDDADTHAPQEKTVKEWPHAGQITYENVNLSYTDDQSEYVLRNLNFTISSREKIGIVGRTGAGKSSIIATLFRLYAVDGRIRIDGVDITAVPLADLRAKISIIPQDPVLFSGTLRDNIDPNQVLSDEIIWKAITNAHLKGIVPTLDMVISENGSNLSVGQRQLICMARAIVRQNRIIILDEATASMDRAMDELIRDTIAQCFRDCTVITIAHKLETILHSADRIMVLDKGQVIEFDTPQQLLQNQQGSFYKMCQKNALVYDK